MNFDLKYLEKFIEEEIMGISTISEFNKYLKNKIPGKYKLAGVYEIWEEEEKEEKFSLKKIRLVDILIPQKQIEVLAPKIKLKENNCQTIIFQPIISLNQYQNIHKLHEESQNLYLTQKFPEITH